MVSFSFANRIIYKPKNSGFYKIQIIDSAGNTKTASITINNPQQIHKKAKIKSLIIN